MSEQKYKKIVTEKKGFGYFEKVEKGHIEEAFQGKNKPIKPTVN